MKKFLKLKAALLSLAMLIASIPGVYAEGSTAISATDGYFWLEAEECTDKHVSWNLALRDGATTNAVSGNGWGISQAQYPGADGYYIDFNINVEEADSYDIYIYGGRVANTQWVSAGKIKIDGTDLTAQPVHYSGDHWGYMGTGTAGINLGWSKATVAIAEGEQVLRYYINDVITGDNTTYQGALDLICVVPSDYGWTPSGTGKTAAKPVAPVPPTVFEFTNGYLWAEGENASAKNGLSEKADSTLSNGSSSAATLATLPTDGYYADFIINVPADDNYVVYFRGTYDDGGTTGGEWSSNPMLKVDGAEKTSQASGTANWFGSSGYYGGWRKSEAASLTAGKHTVRWGFNSSRRGNNYDGIYVGLIDAICIMPADWNWTPSITDMPVAPVYNEFTDGYLWLEAEQNAGTVGSFSTITDGAGHFTDGKALQIKTDPGVIGTTKHSLKYLIDVPATGTYDININGTGNGIEWVSPIKVDIDGAAYNLTAIGSATWYNDWGCKWNTVEAELSQGKHVVTVYTDEKAPASTALFRMIVDALCIVPSEWEWEPSITTMPVAPTYINYAWLEAEEAQTKYGTLTTLSNTCLSNGSALKVMTGTAPTGIGYGVGFDVFMEQAGDYDLYIYGGLDHQWSSASILYANGSKCTDLAALNLTEGWHGGLPCKWQKATAALVEGKNSIDWVINNERTSSSEDTNKYSAAFDTLVIVPAGTPFNPPKTYNDTVEDHDVGAAAAKADYELSILLADCDLANVKNDLTLPTATESGSTVTWTTSNAGVITQDGTVTRSTVKDITVTLTATCGEAQKAFAATVKMIKEYDVDSFAVSGTIVAGNKISASADVKYNLSGSKEVMLIVALYSKDGKLLAVDLDKQNATSAGVDLAAEVTVPANVDLTDAYAKGYLWNGIGDLKPIANAIDL